MSNKLFLDNLWRWKCGLPERDPASPSPDFPHPVDIKALKKTQMSERFLDLMANRVALGTLRYGDWRTGNGGRKFDRVGSIRKRLDEFSRTGNTELLVDIANLAMIEFEITDHPLRHFSPVDDGEHCSEI